MTYNFTVITDNDKCRIIVDCSCTLMPMSILLPKQDGEIVTAKLLAAATAQETYHTTKLSDTYFDIYKVEVGHKTYAVAAVSSRLGVWVEVPYAEYWSLSRVFKAAIEAYYRDFLCAEEVSVFF